MNKFLSILIVFCTTVGLAERIDGPANLRKQTNGEVILSLNDNVEVDLGELKNGWYEMLITVSLTEQEYNSGVIKKGATLLNGKRQEIGVAISDLTLDSKYTGGGAPGVAKWYGGEIYGYTFKSNIKPESIVEPVISKLIDANKLNLKRSAFEEHMKNFGYVEGIAIKDMPQYKTYMVYESIINDPSPIDRVRLIFENDALVAVVHAKDLSLGGYETVAIERGRKLTLLSKFSPDQKKLFIEKNKESYRGMD